MLKCQQLSNHDIECLFVNFLMKINGHLAYHLKIEKKPNFEDLSR